MQPCKSESFTFRRNNFANSSSSSTTSTSSQGNCRRKLRYKAEEKKDNDEETRSDRSVLSVLNLNDTRRVLRNGAERLSKTFNTMRTTLGSISQKFKMPTKRRQILEEGPMTPNCATPHTFSKQVLGRTPTKLYSPFGIESPYNPTTYDKENIPTNINNKKLLK